MVEKYYILANSNDKTFDIPRQLVEINGEKLIERTIRLLKENGVKDITILAKDERFDGLGVKRYEPKNNDYDYATQKGYWLNAFPPEIMNEPVCFIWGDVYFSEEAINKIVETDTDDMMFFCSNNNKDPLYIKCHDEPFAYKIKDTKTFMEHVEKVKKMYDEGLTVRHPIVWEVYRSIYGQNVNEHKMTKGFFAINDITCDIDSQIDVEKLRIKLEKPTKLLSIIIPYYKTFELTEQLMGVLTPQLTDDVEVFIVDDGCNETRLDVYNSYKQIKVIHLEKNGGDSVARNVAIKKAKGEYIAFIDSDDMISNDYVSTLVAQIKDCDVFDMVTFAWKDMNTGNIVRNPRNYAVWKAIYRKDVVPLFVEGRIYSSDVPFQEELSKKALLEKYLDEVLYLYNSGRVGSLTWEKAKKIKEGKL